MMTSPYFLLIIFIVFILFFYIKDIISSIRFKRNFKKYDIKLNISSVEIISHIVVFTLSVINISTCIWALFNNY